MKRHQEVRLTSRTRSSQQILETAIKFAEETKQWSPYPNGIQEDSLTGAHCMVMSEADPAAGVALYAVDTNKRAVDVTNIVPRDKSHLPLPEYNEVARRFAKDLQKYLRTKRLPIKVTITDEERGLEAAIPSKRCREHFNRYLEFYPLSGHPSDLERLDFFICAAHRFGCKTDPYAVAQYLIADLGWQETDATFVRDRIISGLQILKANKRF